MKYLIDTNIFLEIILKQEKAEESKLLLSKTMDYNFIMSDFSLHSIGILLFSQKQHNIFQQFLKDIVVNAGITVISLSSNEMEDIITSAKKFNLDFDDAYQYTIAEKYDLKIVSFDSDFNKTERGKFTPDMILKK